MELAMALLDRGADVNALNIDLRTPLDLNRDNTKILSEKIKIREQCDAVEKISNKQNSRLNLLPQDVVSHEVLKYLGGKRKTKKRKTRRRKTKKQK